MRTTQHKFKLHGSNRQRGAVILLVTFSLIAFLGLAALVLDFGRLYIIESQLQNAADAGALRGAKDLNGTADQLDDACQHGVEGALTNQFLLVADALSAGDLKVEVSSEPFDANWVTLKNFGGSCSSGGAPANNNLYFMRVTADAGGVPSFLGGILNIWENSAKALAVAGRYSVNITPLAVCAIDPDDCASGDCGFLRGQSYKVKDLNPVGPGTMYWVDPFATNENPVCNFPDANSMRPFLCQGIVGSPIATATHVYTNTGQSTGPSFAALDSRFGDYDSQGQCDSGTAPPDTNIKQYIWPDPHETQTADQTKVDWVTPITRQAANVTRTEVGSTVTFNVSADGVSWAANSPPPANPIPGQTFIPSEYPSSGTPFDQTTVGEFFQPPTCPPPCSPEHGRRLLNIVIVNCVSMGGSCRQIQKVGIGEFLMVKKSNTPSDKDVYIEYRRTVSPGELWPGIKLYR